MEWVGPQRELAGGPASAGAGAAGGEQGSVLECCPAARRHSPAQASITHFTSYHHNISHSSRDAGRGWRRWRAWAAPPPTTPPPWTCLSSAAPLATRRCAALTDGGCLVARVWVQAVPRALVGEVGSTPGSGIERKGRRFSDAGLRCPPAQLSAAQLTSQRARAPCPPRPPARLPTRAQKLEGRCRKDGPQAAFTRLEHTEVPALRAHVHDTARRCAHVSCVVPAAGGRAPRGAAAAGQGWGVGRRKGAGAGVGAAAGAAAGAQPWRSLPAPWGQPWGQPWGRPRSRSRSCSRRPCPLLLLACRGRIHAARSLATAVSSFVSSTALLLLDAGAELDEEAGADVRRAFDAQVGGSSTYVLASSGSAYCFGGNGA